MAANRQDNILSRIRRAAAAFRSSAATGWLPWWGGAGLTFPNADIADTRYGYGMAYTMVTSVYRAVSLRADALDALPWRIERHYSKEQTEIIADSSHPYTHPLGAAIARHRQGLGKSFFYELSANYDLFGERYVEIAHHPVTRRVGFRVLHAAFVTPMLDGRRVTSYLYGDGRTTITFSADEVAFDARWNPNDTIRGLSLVSVALDSVNVDRNLKRFLRDFFYNNARPGLVIAPEGELNTFSSEQQARIRAEIQNYHKGAGGQYGTLVLDKPASVTALEQSDLATNVPLMEKIERDTLRTFGVPSSMAGDDTASTYKQGREVYENFVANTIIPLAMDTADFVQTQLMPYCADAAIDRFVFDTEHLEYVSDAVMQKHEMVRQDYNSGLITLNEAREQIGYAPLPEGDRRAPQYEPPPSPQPPNNPPDQPPSALPADAPGNQPDYPSADRAISDVLLVPTLEMADEAARALRWREEYGRGGTAVGVARARDIMNRRRLSPDTVQRMASYFARHASDREALGWNYGEEGFPSAGRIAWGLWGGDPGRDWAARKLDELARARERGTRTLAEAASDLIGADLLHLTAHDLMRAKVKPRAYDANAALTELRAWQQFARRRRDKANPRPFEPVHLRGPIAAEIERALAQNDTSIWRRMEQTLRPDWLGATVSVMRLMERYQQINFTPPSAVVQNAREGLALYQQHNRGTADDITGALVRGADLSVEQARELAAWWAAHTPGGEGYYPGDEGYPSAAAIDALLRGGEPGRSWATDLLTQIELADRQMDKIKDDFGGLLLPLLLLVANGNMTDEALRERMRALIRQFAELAYKAGLAEGGILDDLTPKQQQRIDVLLARQQTMIDQFIDELLAKRLSEAEMEQRVRLWANGALQPIYNEAVNEANADGLYMWVEGDTINKCRDCVRLDGQIHRWSEYVERNLMPQTPGQATACEGWLCQCSLMPVVGRSRGNW